MCIMGNVRASLLSLGSPNDIEKEVKKIIDGCKEGGGLIVSAETPDDTKLENIQTLIKVAKEYGRYKK